MNHAYLLHHEKPETDDIKVIGLYSSELLAKAAIGRLRVQPGFCDYPDCFSIDDYRLDEDHWVEGFGVS